MMLFGKTFSRHILQDEATRNTHPNNSGILYVSLTRLAKESTSAGELAQFLLGKITTPKDEAVKKIANTFISSFRAFKEDKEVTKMLSLQERFEHDGMVKGMAKSVERMLELLKAGLSPEEASRIIKEENNLSEA